MSRSDQIIRHAGFYSAASLLTQAVTVSAAIFMRRFLGPYQVGAWALIQLVLIYTDYATLGVSYATSREIPFLLGKGEPERANEIKNTTFSFCLLMSLLTAAGVWGFVFLYKARLEAELFHGLLFASVLIVLQRLNDVMVSLLRAYKQFTVAGKQIVYSALVNALLIIIFSYRFRFYGFLWAMCLSFVFNIAYIFLKSELRFQWEISWSRLSALIGYGLPLLGLAAMGTLILTADKLIISRFLGLEALGLYSIAAMTLTYLYSFPNSIGIVLIPNVHEKFGERQNPLDLTGYLDKAAYFYSNAMPALIVFAWFTMPYLVCLLLPKFAAGIPALQLLILGAYFMALNEPHNNFLIVIKKHFCLFPITFLSAVFTFFLVFVVVRRGGGIKGAASAMSLSFFLNFSMVFFFARGCVGSLKETISNYLVLVLKFLGMAAFIYVISFLTGPMRPLQAFVSQMTLCAIFSLLPALLICRRFAIWDALVSRFLKSG